MKILRIQRESVAYDYIVEIARQLKWAWCYLFYQSFVFLNGSSEDDLLCQSRHENTRDSGDHGGECAVCLDRIDEEDEVGDIKCSHLFHRACLDRWVWSGHVTCPLCRSNIRPPLLEAELRREIIQIRFWATAPRDGDSDRWWLR